VIFFPAYTPGRLTAPSDLYRTCVHCEHDGSGRGPLADGLTRIVMGLFKKFVIADSLAQGMSLNATNAGQVHSTLWLWCCFTGTRCDCILTLPDIRHCHWPWPPFRHPPAREF